jgi:hypothetical protein
MAPRFLKEFASAKPDAPTRPGRTDKSKDDSRSGRADRRAIDLVREGCTYEEMRKALLEDDDRDIAAWARESVDAGDNERQLHRAFDHAQGFKKRDGSGRALSLAPAIDAPFKPVMRLLDKHMRSAAPEPPMRAMDGRPVSIVEGSPLGMHELTEAGADAEEAAEWRLPAPLMHMLNRHDAYTLALYIEDYINFYKWPKKEKDGSFSTTPTRLPKPFVEQYLRYTASELPRVKGLLTMPVVLPGGRVLAENGLDRKWQLVFRIPPEIVELVPKGPPSPEEVRAAMLFLINEWLIDVPMSIHGKCILIGIALNIIERWMFTGMPANFVTAGKRGGGKTTLLHMISLAVLGKLAAAMAWSRDQEERKKALFAAFLQDAPFIVWDNIAAGSSLSCTSIEAALTSGELQDRLLGKSKIITVPCASVPAFTGNNIQPRGDMASRSLISRIEVDRPDPENRYFAHPDPFQWTRDNQGRILKALYTILLGNPRLAVKPREREQGKTRFKPWWHLIGAAIENAAQMMGHTVDFEQLFKDSESDDEEAASITEVLQTLDRLTKGKIFRSKHVAIWLQRMDEDAHVLRGFFEVKQDVLPTESSITRKLRTIRDNPVCVGAEASWKLGSRENPNGKVREFLVRKRASLTAPDEPEKDWAEAEALGELKVEQARGKF